MSGHSKFANIKHKKEKNDAAKGKIFTILGREIAVAVKEGGPDPANNFMSKVTSGCFTASFPEQTSVPFSASPKARQARWKILDGE